VSFVFRPLYPRKESSVPIGHEVGWASETGWITWRGEKLSSFRVSNSNPSAVQFIVAIPTIVTNKFTSFLSYDFNALPAISAIFKVKYAANV
jgi:hypothetical protein